MLRPSLSDVRTLPYRKHLSWNNLKSFNEDLILNITRREPTAISWIPSLTAEAHHLHIKASRLSLAKHSIGRHVMADAGLANGSMRLPRVKPDARDYSCCQDFFV